QQRLDIAADWIEQLPLVHEISVRLSHEVLDALLPPREHELLELTVRREQHFGGRRLECNAALRADDRIAQMDPAADAKRRGQRFQRLDHRHGGQRLAIESYRPTVLERNRMALR